MNYFNKVTSAFTRLKGGKAGRKLLVLTALTSLIAQPLPLMEKVNAAAATNPQVTLVSEEPITSGAVLRKYVFSTTRGNDRIQTNANVVAIDLKNPYVKLDVMTGKNNQFTKTQTVREMAKETGAVAGINGDYFNTAGEKAPIGPEIQGSRLMASSSAIAGMYAFALTNDNVPIIDLAEHFKFDGSVTAADGSTFTVTGMNKTYYTMEANVLPNTSNTTVHSHANAMYLYTDTWGQIDRAKDGATTPTEVLVRNGTISQIVVGGQVQMSPPSDGYILRTHGKAADYVKQHMKEGDSIKLQYKLTSTTNAGVSSDNLKTMIGGHTILVDGGKATAFSRSTSSISGNRSRTGVGYSQDQRYVYLITSDNSGDSKGMSVAEFQQFMVLIGVYKGMNLDGGGSTQLVSRPLGETDVQIANATEFGTERKIVNSLGVYTTAPKGDVKGINISGNKILFINEQANFQMKAYDQYYNPVDAATMPVTWSVSNGIGSFQGNTFIPAKSGTAAVTAASGKASANYNIQVVGRNDIDHLVVDAPESILIEGASYRLPVKAVTKSGDARVVPSELIKWEFNGVQGQANGNTVTITKINDNSQAGQLIASYDGFKTMITMATGVNKMWADFDNKTVPVSFSGLPKETTGSADVVWGLPGVSDNNQILYLTYDFTQGTGSRFAYANFGDKGIAIGGKPYNLKMNVLGDNSLNWLRAEVTDGKGATQYIDLAKVINWTGWQPVSVNLSDLKLQYPITLKRVYVVNVEKDQDERSLTGAVGFDDISFQYAGSGIQKPAVNVQLTLDQKTVNANGKQVKLDQPAVLSKNTTFVPLKFVVDALGGTLNWDQTEKKVTVLRLDKLVELWMNKPDMVLNGQRLSAAVSPQIMQGRTMVPLRLISENLGLKVLWNQSTKTITIQ